MTRLTDRRNELAPDRPRLGAHEHPNLERPDAKPHPAMRPHELPRLRERSGRAGERGNA
jgi:hypothetical protein